MPQLPGGGGNKAIVEALQRLVHYPAAALRQQLQGRVFVSFLVTESGEVRNGKIVKGIGGGCDEEVLAAVRLLPRFIPGTQQGRPVSVSFTVPVTFNIQDTKSVAADTLTRIYQLVDQMPRLPSGEGSRPIAQAIQRALVMPAEVANDSLLRKVFVGFIVGPSGVIRDVKVIRGLSANCNAAALAAVKQLPRFVGGKLNGLPASVSMTVPVLFGRLPQKP
ncbi:TonB family protein [Hymenobacter siberiensis]|uniref:TonB family protein n=1 Tax=Hymenobacter siberiensis TaxID=2848396 RepID=UPI001C1DEB30|nr:TonB family protein [Hymenobacter siberiensis]MBU6119771.1 energy transducer TonB [Hymenobacter siberiensis]